MRLHTFPELTTRISSQLYSLTSDLTTASYTISDIGDYLPGSILINDMQLLKNVYMSNSGCRILQKEKEELQQMGAAYFDEFFDEQEMPQLLSMFHSMVAAKDCRRVSTYFQKVRPNKQTGWKWFFVSFQILPASDGTPSSSVILMAQDASNLKTHQEQIQRILPAAPLPDADYLRFSSLTKREKDVLALITKGFTSQQIADALFVAVSTIETHRKRIKQKLEARNTIDLIRYATLFAL